MNLTPEQYQRAHELFSAAVRLPQQQRPDYLAEACGSDDALRAEVETLLAHDREDPEFLRRDDDRPAPRRIVLPKRISGYRVQKFLGEGGMGVVCLAEQIEPRRSVALKVLRPEFLMSSRQDRFRHEVAVLGRLRHPGIAQIYEAGTFESPSGTQPFFAMELVKGRSLMKWVGKTRPSLRDRLELFIQVCDAVHHAHAQGVIHRDLKPANILVDESGRAKVLDFGVARATDSDMQTVTQTGAGLLVGTLPYMSPEQAAGDPARLDTRSDVYSLGVLLYELLSERLPYDVTTGMIHEAVRTIREEEPEPLGSIHRAFRGDLETIAGKAMDKEPSRRYQSASALADDLRRHLNLEPIAARAPTVMYQLGKFARRHRTLVAGLAAVIVVLCLGIVGTSWGWIEVGRQRMAADEAYQAADQQRLSAERARDEAEAANQSARQARDEAEASQQQERRQREIAEQAQRHAERETERAEAVVGFIITALDELRRDHRSSSDVETMYLKAIAFCEAELGEDDPRMLTFEHGLAEFYVAHDRVVEAETLFRETLSARRRVLGEDHPETLTTMSALASLLSKEKRYGEAEPMYRTVLSRRAQTLGVRDPDTVGAQADLAGLFRRQGRDDLAEPLYRSALTRYREALGTADPETLVVMDRLAGVYFRLARFEEAEQMYLQFLDDSAGVLEESDRLGAMGHLSKIYVLQKRFGEAETHALARHQGELAIHGEDHRHTRTARSDLADLYAAWGRDADAAVWRVGQTPAEDASGPPDPRPEPRGSSFFGIAVRGTHIAFVIDSSGSMSQDGRINMVGRELAGSLANLPAGSHFYLALFSSTVTLPPGQSSWVDAIKRNTSAASKWFLRIDPGGGSQPAPALDDVLRLRPSADAVFLVTDGQIPPNFVDELIRRNRGAAVVINTIAVGNQSPQLQQLAQATGGEYRFIPPGVP